MNTVKIKICKFSLEECEDTKGVIRVSISKKNRQHNGQMKKYKRTNNYKKIVSTKHTHTTEDRVTRTPLNPGVNSGAPEG
jgi:hypothetical protein